MYYTVYKTTNLKNGKFYIGKHQTKNLDDAYLGSGKLLGRAIRKHGRENFKKEILEVFDTEEKMNLAEKILVVFDLELSYNLCEGGNGGFGYINRSDLAHRVTKEHAVKGGLSAKKNSKGWFSKEAKQSKAVSLQQYFKDGGINGFEGKKHTDAALKKITAASKGRPSSTKGKPRSEETKRKIAETLRNRNTLV